MEIDNGNEEILLDVARLALEPWTSREKRNMLELAWAKELGMII
jgi:hypothetical protein